MSKELRYSNASESEAFESVIGNLISRVNTDEIEVIEPTGEKRFEEIITIVTVKQSKNKAIGRNIEFIGEECFISEEYIADEGGLKNE